MTVSPVHEDSKTSMHRHERIICVAIFLCSVVINLSFSAIGLKNSLFEIHVFRQLQTALTARSIQEMGWSLAYPTPLFGPPWSAPMEFPWYQLFVAKFDALTGLPLDVAGRLVSLGFLYLTLPACFGLMGVLEVPRSRRWLFPALLLLSPAYLYYSRCFMIESTALCASVWFLFTYCRSVQNQGWKWMVAAAGTGILAGTAKVTTFAVFLVTAAVFTVWYVTSNVGSQRRWLRFIAFGFGATAPGVAVAYLWVRYSDAIKATNPLTDVLTSSKLSEFNWGTLAQRLSPEFWAKVFTHISIAVINTPALSFAIALAVLLSARLRSRALVLMLGFLAGPLLFSNLYFVHDYYFYANGILLLGVLVLAWSQLLDLEVFSAGAKWAVIVATVALQVASYLPTYFKAQLRPIEETPELGSILNAVTKPDDVVLVFGQDWDARLSYTSHRRAIMVTYEKSDDLPAVDNVLDRLPQGTVTALVVTGKLRKYQAHFTTLIKRLNLHPDAFLLNDETMVFLAESRLSSAMTALEQTPPKTFQLPAPRVSGDFGISRIRYQAATLDPQILAMMQPTPVAVVHPFTPGTNEENRQTVFNAHVPTDVIFAVPPGAKTAEAEFGILAAAYEGTNHTDGVEFRVEWVKPGGEHRILYSVYLNPGPRGDDRGLKTLHIALPEDRSGQLWFRTVPGANGSISCGWAYWKRIEIR